MRSLVVLGFLLLSSFVSFGQSAEGIIEKYLEVTQAKSVDEEMKNYAYKKDYVANSSTDFQEEVNVIGAEKKMSRKKTLLERDFFYVLNGSTGWIKIPMGSRDKAPTYTVKNLSDKEVSELSNELKDGLLPFANFKAKGYTLMGDVIKVNIEGVDTYQINLVRGDTKREYSFDASTGLLKREMLSLAGVVHTTDHLQYATAKNGVKYPSVSTYFNTKDKRKTALTTEWIFDVLPTASMFSK